uniref:Acyltransferase 3 domain-containing protein n=1 Tax=Anopheles atroparvus TaxID=41427 RepID=A0AAG5DL57_ANOAO
MQQSWHLAADFQFFLVGVPFLLLIHRHPRLKIPLIFGAAVFSFAAPIMNLYHWKLPGVILVNFKQLRFIFYAHPALEYDYMLSHAHTCSYFSGIFAGLGYHRFRGGSAVVAPGGRNPMWRLPWAPTVMVFLQASLSPLFYDLDYSEPMLWNAIYGAIHRCCWGAMCAIGILHGATVWRGRHARIHFHPVLLVLSRLSFGVFMVQFSVLKSLARNATDEGIDFSWRIYLESVAYTLVGCYAAALLLALFVELPFAAVFKRVLGNKSSKSSQKRL